MVFAFRYQPFKAIYTLSTVAGLLLRLPYWTLINLLPSWRPRTTWTLGRAIFVNVFQVYIAYVYETGIPTPAYPKEDAPDAATTGLVFIDPVPTELIVGEVKEFARVNNVQPVRTAGFWIGPRGPSGEVGQKASPGEKVIYHLHGGGYVMGTANPSSVSMKYMYEGLQEHLPNTRIFALEYRLSSAEPFGRANPFPTALIDAISGYRYLLKVVGFSANDIVIGGDSAGGNLAFVLAYYISKYQLPSLPAPRGMILLSPSADAALTHVGRDSSMYKHSRSDFVGPIFQSGYSKRALLGYLPDDVALTVWFSPGTLHLAMTKDMFANLPKTLMITGGAEMTLDPMRTLRDRMVVDMGHDAVTYVEAPDSTHDFLVLPLHEPERTDALRILAGWVNSL
ncbi:alpha/beta-hydrolase [Laetiporus sulphureus 93-53]|uniref:Alpha/beta-hydrolase n=1 Tax=Laetiporus sulphureus 93-53 TaxID=1314785 RepID=A0A165BX08_9APHY|nr:alpha/beta-hydrolase [Laetiporus sulphureus 93-53]KZT01804.1 alpha/beta-hydrolase [Laetiporus sulphureus 93-53]